MSTGNSRISSKAVTQTVRHAASATETKDESTNCFESVGTTTGQDERADKIEVLSQPTLRRNGKAALTKEAQTAAGGE